MTEHDPNNTERASSAEAYIGISINDLATMPDAELANWQAGWKSGTVNHILAEKEWERRITLRNIKEQFKLEERLANGNRWWSIAAAVIGVVGTLAGVGIGKWLESSPTVPPKVEIPALTQSAQ